MIYNNIEDIFRDFNYLVKNCNIDYLCSKPETGVIQKYSELIKSSDDKFVCKFYQELLKEFDLKVSNYKSKVSYFKLPVMILIPNKGLRICIEITAEKFFKVEGADGIDYFEILPNGSKVMEFAPIVNHNIKVTASKMFKEVAFKQKKYIASAIIASLSINIFALVTSLYSMQVYDRVIPTGGISTLISLSVGAFIAIFLEFLLKISRSLILEKANKNMDMEYSYTIFDKFLKIRSDTMPKSIGILSGQLQSYSSVRGFISSFIVFILIDFPFALFFLFIILMVGGIEVGLVVFSFLILAILSGMLYKNKIEFLTKTSTMSSYKKLSLLVESVENQESIKSTYNGWKIQIKWNKLTNDNIEDDLKIKHFTDVSSYMTSFLQQISYIALVATGAYIVSTSDKLTMGALIAVTILSGRTFAPISSIPSLFVAWGKAKMSINDLNNIFKLESDNNGIKKGLTPVFHNVDLSCNDIAFSYNEKNPLFTVKRLYIAQGEKIGILGTIGSGKSTLMKILAGLYKVKEGIVTLNAIDIQQISRERIAQRIGYLPQNVKLLSGTLRDNLTLGIVGVADEEIIEVSKESGLIHLINILPQGLDTPIPDGSDSVSGGQRQLIGITRLMILNPDIWLLDEPTANIDEMSERLILNYLNTKLHNKTLILISHKQQNFAIVNRLVVVAQNTIIADGQKNDVIAQLSAPNLNNNNFNK